MSVKHRMINVEALSLALGAWGLSEKEQDVIKVLYELAADAMAHGFDAAEEDPTGSYIWTPIGRI